VKIICEMDRLRIEPRSIKDQVFLQEVLGLRKTGDSILLVCDAIEGPEKALRGYPLITELATPPRKRAKGVVARPKPREI
jgi:hypothetical protein